MTDWDPHYSGYDGFREGLKNTIKWFSDPQNLSCYSEKYEI